MFRKKERLSFSEIVGDRFESFQWQINENLNKKLESKLSSSEMDNARNDLFDELPEESDFCSLILPVEKFLKENKQCFYKNCTRLQNYQPDSSIIKTLLEKVPYLEEAILENRKVP